MFPRLEEVLPPYRPKTAEELEELGLEEDPGAPKPAVVDKFKIYTRTFPKGFCSFPVQPDTLVYIKQGAYGFSNTMQVPMPINTNFQIRDPMFKVANREVDEEKPKWDAFIQ